MAVEVVMVVVAVVVVVVVVVEATVGQSNTITSPFNNKVVQVLSLPSQGPLYFRLFPSPGRLLP